MNKVNEIGCGIEFRALADGFAEDINLPQFGVLPQPTRRNALGAVFKVQLQFCRGFGHLGCGYFIGDHRHSRHAPAGVQVSYTVVMGCTSPRSPVLGGLASQFLPAGLGTGSL